MKRPVSATVVLAMALSSPWPALADGPGPDGEPPRPRESRPRASRDVDEPETRPARRVIGSPDYVGSAWGLGKPSYYGLGTRPDWGRSSVD